MLSAQQPEQTETKNAHEITGYKHAIGYAPEASIVFDSASASNSSWRLT